MGTDQERDRAERGRGGPGGSGTGRGWRGSPLGTFGESFGMNDRHGTLLGPLGRHSQDSGVVIESR